MKAVNLIPTDGAVAGRRRSGAGAYAVLGVLALLVAMSTIYTLAGRALDTKRAELSAVTAQAQSVETKASGLKVYADALNTRNNRVETVKSLTASRFDWSNAMHEVARTLPSGAWVLSMRATVNPSVSVDGTPDPLRASLAVPAIELGGCADKQSGVASVLSALRGMDGVQRVSLSKSEKAQDAVSSSNSDSAGSAQQGCGTRPQFSLTVFFEAPASSATASTTASTTGVTP
jgi:Tfp pilus assembly protein PilN